MKGKLIGIGIVGFFFLSTVTLVNEVSDNSEFIVFSICLSDILNILAPNVLILLIRTIVAIKIDIFYLHGYYGNLCI